MLYNLSLFFLLKCDSPLNWSTHKSLQIWPNDDVLASVTPAKFYQRLSLITSLTQSIALTRKRCIIVIKKTIQRNHMLAIFALILEDAIFGYWPLPHFCLSRIPIWRMAPVISLYLMSKILFSLLYFKFAQCYTSVMKKKKAKHKKLLNIFCIVYI